MLQLFSRRPGFQSAVAGLERYDIAPDIRAHLAAFLHDSPDREVFHFNPRALAGRMNLADAQTGIAVSTVKPDGRSPERVL